MTSNLVTRFFCVAALLVPFAPAGCGSNPATSELRGKVTFKGKPVVQGQLSVISADGRVESCSIDDGVYLLRRAPVGQHLQVAITGATYLVLPDPEFKEKMMKRANDPKTDYPEPKEPEDPRMVPSKYLNPQTSGLTVDVKPDQPVHDFDLTD
jgi:hypothetical protein